MDIFELINATPNELAGYVGVSEQELNRMLRTITQATPEQRDAMNALGFVGEPYVHVPHWYVELHFHWWIAKERWQPEMRIAPCQCGSRTTHCTASCPAELMSILEPLLAAVASLPIPPFYSVVESVTNVKTPAT